MMLKIGLLLLDFPEWLLEQRLARRLDSKECAARAGVAPQVWSEWESGGTKRKGDGPWQPRMGTLRKIATALDVPISEAMAAAGYVGEHNETDFDHLPPDLQRVYALQGKAFKVLPPGKARDRYIASLRANAELILEMETRLGETTSE